MKSGERHEQPHETPGEQEVVAVARPPYERMDDQEAETLTRQFVESYSYHGYAPGTRRALARLVLELRDRLPDYGTILSDEVSGRIPSLIIRRLVKNAREKQGLDTPRSDFIIGGYPRGGWSREKQNDIVGEYLTENSENMKERGRVALVTEYIDSGASISPIVKKIEDLGIDFDLISVSVNRNLSSYEDVIQRHLIYGEKGNAGIVFWGKSASGVKKSERDSPHPVVADRDSSRSRIEVQKARENAVKISSELQELLDAGTTREDENTDDRELIGV